MAASSDAQLVERARTGDRDAAGRLVRRHQGAVYAVALARVRDPLEAQEVAQEALVRALSELQKLRDAARFGAYAVRITIRLAADRGRRRKPLPLAEMTDPAPGPVEGLQQRERSARLLEELNRLPDEAYRVLFLRHLEGASYARIARLLEIPEGTVAWVLHRARRSLRESLRDLVEDER